jgi:hypothetical protein
MVRINTEDSLFEAFTAVTMQPPAHAGSSLADFSTLKMEAIRSSETSVPQDLHDATSQKTAFFNTENASLVGVNNIYANTRRQGKVLLKLEIIITFGLLFGRLDKGEFYLGNENYSILVLHLS